MKVMQPLLALLLTILVLAANETPAFAQGQPKLRIAGVTQPDSDRPGLEAVYYVDCYPDKVIIYPGNITNTWEALQVPDNPVEKMLDNVQAHTKTEALVVMARPKSVKFFRTVRKMVSQRPIEVSYDPVDTGVSIVWQEPPPERKPVPPVFRPTGNPIGDNRQLVFFECRADEVYFVDKQSLDEQAQKLLARVSPDVKDLSGFAKVINGAEAGNECYKVIPSYLLTAVLALEPRPNVHGESEKAMAAPTSKFQQALGSLNPAIQVPVFLVRDDSFRCFRAARKAAEALGLKVGWELLGQDEPIKFGLGGSLIGVE